MSKEPKFDPKWSGNVLGMAALNSLKKSQFKKEIKGHTSLSKDEIRDMLKQKVIKKT